MPSAEIFVPVGKSPAESNVRGLNVVEQPARNMAARSIEQRRIVMDLSSILVLLWFFFIKPLAAYPWLENCCFVLNVTSNKRQLIDTFLSAPPSGRYLPASVSLLYQFFGPPTIPFPAPGFAPWLLEKISDIVTPEYAGISG